MGGGGFGGFVGDVFGGGGGLLGGITDFVGITNFKGQKADQKRADALAGESISASKANIEMQREQLAFMQKQYDEWNAVYGDLQQNLGDYYANLSIGDEFKKIDTNLSFTLQSLSKEYATAAKDTQRAMSQMGLAGSGAAAQNTVGLNQGLAQSRAMARAQAGIGKLDAGDIVAQKQMGFLGVGLGQGASLLGTMTQQAGNAGNAYNSLTQAAGNLSNNYMQRGMGREASNMGVIRNLTGYNQFSGFTNSMATSAGETMGGGMASGLLGGMFSDRNLKENIRFIKEAGEFKIYSWSWNKEAESLYGLKGKDFGVIAQDLLQYHEDKVGKSINGHLIVDYSKLPESVQKEIEELKWPA